MESSREKTPRGNEMRALLSVAPESLLNELFNIVHCAAADVADRFEEVIISSAAKSEMNPESVLRGVEELYEDMVRQIEETMTVFVAVALETCLSAPLATVEAVQRRRSTVLLDTKDLTKEMETKEEVLELVKSARMYHIRFVQAQGRLEELNKMKERYAEDLHAMEIVPVGLDGAVQEIQKLLVRTREMQRVIAEGQKWKDSFAVKRRSERVPSEKSKR